ncbi:universal stress protein [Tabrizicola sp. M-4]|uniref:universal stress protein n=1 Tax=Tabrizicola sp. M-4 TaxID=3055847 RepID=UPI003DA8B62C
MKSVLLATDFSERSDRALRRAVLLARQHGAVIHLLHVVDDDRPARLVEHEVADARSLLKRQKRSLTRIDGIRAEISVTLADPFAGIVEAARTLVPDLLILGPHRKQILRDAFVGTTAERVIRAASCPVLSVNGPPVAPYAHVLLTTDLSDASKSALRRVFDTGLSDGLRQSLLHVHDAPALRLAVAGSLPDADREHLLAEAGRDARRDLLAFMDGLSPQPIRPEIRHRDTTDAAEILKAAHGLHADLVMVATQGKGALARLMLGSVTQNLFQTAEVDILAIPPQAA